MDKPDNNIEKKLTLRDYLIILFRRKNVFFTFFISLVAIVTIASFTMKPLFRAEAMILVEKAEEEPLVTLKEVITDLADRVALVTTQVEMVKSRWVLESVVRKLELDKKLPVRGSNKFEKAVIFLQKKVKVRPVKNTDFIDIRLEMHNRDLVAPIVNEIAKYYIAFYFDTKKDNSRKKYEFIQEQVIAVKNELDRAEELLRDYEVKNRVILPDEEAKLALRNLMEEQRRLAILLQDYSDVHPSVLGASDAIKEFENELKALPQKKMEITRIKYTITALKEVYIDLIKKREEMRIITESEKREVGQIRSLTLVDPAVKPIKPVWPIKRLNVLLAMILGFLGGISLSVMVDLMDDRLYQKEDVKKKLGVWPVGSVRLLSEKGRGVLDTVPDRGFFDLNQGVLNNIGGPGVPVKTLMVTSSFPGEGKTTAAFNLALVLSKYAGKKVLLVDLDAKHSDLHKLCKTSLKPGLVDFLQGRSDMKDLVQKTELDNLFLLPAGSREAPGSLLVSENIEKLKAGLNKVKDDFDCVIIDSPDGKTSVNISYLTSIAEYILFIVRAGATRWQSARHSIDMISTAPAGNLGVMLNCQKYYIPDFIYHML